MFKNIKNTLFSNNIGCGYLYFYIHLIVEIVCFYFLSSIIHSSIIWLIPFIYDGLAFVPQALFGKLNDIFYKINFGIIGVLLLFLGIFLYGFTNCNIFIELIIISIGNALLHVRGAEVTLKNSGGKLSCSALFVSGGSFGVVIGKILGSISTPKWVILILILTMIPFIILADTYHYSKEKANLVNFDYDNKKLNPYLVVFLSVFVVIVRGFMGYGIPTSWNKTITQLVVFYFTMGLGKALGGILVDNIGIKKTIFISTICAIPFLCFGDKYMFISLIGVMLFSMTMAITLGILTSVLNKSPGLAFGLTTISLFLGTVPIFFVKLSPIANILFIIIFSILSFLILLKITKKGDYHDI